MVIDGIIVTRIDVECGWQWRWCCSRINIIFIKNLLLGFLADRPPALVSFHLPRLETSWTSSSLSLVWFGLVWFGLAWLTCWKGIGSHLVWRAPLELGHLNHHHDQGLFPPWPNSTHGEEMSAINMAGFCLQHVPTIDEDGDDRWSTGHGNDLGWWWGGGWRSWWWSSSR